MNLTKLASLPSVPHRLVTWYLMHQRDLPWRTSPNPYFILVSETMLQQTRVETVIPYYHRFLAAFPTIHDLAQAEETQVMKLWQGLGYYSRARNLHRAAKVLDTDYAGSIPVDHDAISNLPGVGPYTVGAVMSIAFDEPVPAVDGNVLRVVSRHRGVETSIQKAPAKNQITAIVADWVKKERPSDFTQALMELGATVCTPKSASCLVCPIADDCNARLTGRVGILPVKEPKKKRKSKWIGALYLEFNHSVLVEQRPQEGLLQGMWQLPSIELDEPPSNEQELHKVLSEKLGAIFRVESVAESAEPWYVKRTEENHVFTHIDWHVEVYQPSGLSSDFLKNVFTRTQRVEEYEGGLDWSGPSSENQTLQLVAKSDIPQLVLSRVYEKIFSTLLA